MLRAASLVVSAVLIQAPPAGLSPDRDPARLRPGLFLYAAPGVAEPRFGETVVLLVEHGPQGSMGLVVNRPTEVRLARALKLADRRGDELPLYWGGPVQPEAIHALVRAVGPESEARTVVKDVYVTGALSDVKAALAGRDPAARLRVYSGYAGWAAGQLAGEVRAGVWVLDRADAGSVFAAEPEKLWLRVHQLLDRLEARAPACAAPPAWRAGRAQKGPESCPAAVRGNRGELSQILAWHGGRSDQVAEVVRDGRTIPSWLRRKPDASSGSATAASRSSSPSSAR